MKIEKKVTATIYLDQWEIEILQRFLDYARRYATIHARSIISEDYSTDTEFKVDFEKVAQKILDL